MATSQLKFEDSEIKEPAGDTNREKWSHKIEYTLSMIGYCVGPGNIWRFPYICMRNGGGAFLIPYLFFLLIWGLPLFFIEVAHGQFIGKGILNAWEICPLFRGLGLGMVLLDSILVCYFNMITAWTLYYIVSSFFNPLPWSTCNNNWNTEDCVSDRSVMLNSTSIGTQTHQAWLNCSNCSSFNNTLNKEDNLSNASQIVTSEEEFWQYNVLQMSSGLEEFGSLPWHLSVCLLVAWVILNLGIIQGIRSVGKVVYVTATLPYIILMILLIRGLTLPGGVDGILFYFKPDFSRLDDTQVWIEAALQVFFSLGPCWGGLVTLASYNKFKNNCLRDAVFLTFFNEGTSIFAGMAVFSVLGYMAKRTHLSIGNVVKSGPGLGFMAYPEAIAQLPVSNLWAVLFFIMLLSAVVDSMFASLEILCSALTDTFTFLRKRKFIVSTGICCICFLIQLPMCSQGGIYIFQLVDWYIGANAVFVFGFLECIIFGWIYGIERFSRDVTLMIERPIPVFLRVCVCFLTPAVLAISFCVTLATFKPPNYGSYQYPGYAELIGWSLASIPLVPVIVYFVIELRRAKGTTIFEKLSAASRPSKRWKPNNETYRNLYDQAEREDNVPFLERIKINVLGEN